MVSLPIPPLPLPTSSRCSSISACMAANASCASYVPARAPGIHTRASGYECCSDGLTAPVCAQGPPITNAPPPPLGVHNGACHTLRITFDPFGGIQGFPMRVVTMQRQLIYMGQVSQPTWRATSFCASPESASATAPAPFPTGLPAPPRRHTALPMPHTQPDQTHIHIHPNASYLCAHPMPGSNHVSITSLPPSCTTFSKPQ